MPRRGGLRSEIHDRADVVETAGAMLVLAIGALLTRKTAAGRLGISPTRLDQLRREGAIDGFPTPLGHLYDPDAVEALRTEREGRSGRNGGTDR